MNNFFIYMSPLTGMVGYGGGGTGLTFHGDSGVPWYGDRAIKGGGSKNWDADSSRNKRVIEYVSISTGSNTSDFGTLVAPHEHTSATQGNGRALFFGGHLYDEIDYFAIATTGNASSFGEQSFQRRLSTACSDGLRALNIGGLGDTTHHSNPGEPKTDTIDYVEIDTLGDATDFGNCVDELRYSSAVSDGIKGISAGGMRGTSGQVFGEQIEQVVIQTTGNASDFGDLTADRAHQAPGGDATRAVMMGGRNTSNQTTADIDYFSMQTSGNASDFGDQQQSVFGGTQSAVGDHSKALVMGGEDENTPGAAYVNKIQYIVVQTTGNGTDFGNLLMTDRMAGGCAGD